jgi:aerobic C4-dicarboxylate transport protein
LKAFNQPIKGLIVPLLVATITRASPTDDRKSVGRMGGKAPLYFEIITTLALIIRMVMAKVLRSGAALALDLGAQVRAPARPTVSRPPGCSSARTA